MSKKFVLTIFVVVIGLLVALLAFSQNKIVVSQKLFEATPTPKTLVTANPEISFNKSLERTIPSISVDLSPNAKPQDKAIYLVRTKSGVVKRYDLLPADEGKLNLTQDETLYDVIPPRSMVGVEPRPPSTDTSATSVQTSSIITGSGKIQGTPPPGPPPNQ